MLLSIKSNNIKLILKNRNFCKIFTFPLHTKLILFGIKVILYTVVGINLKAHFHSGILSQNKIILSDTF